MENAEVAVTLEDKLNILANLKNMLIEKQHQFDYENSDLIYEIKSLEEIVKTEVYRRGETVKTDKITVSYSKGRETWDGKKLSVFAKDYPWLESCKKSVSLRLALGCYHENKKQCAVLCLLQCVFHLTTLFICSLAKRVEPRPPLRGSSCWR